LFCGVILIVIRKANTTCTFRYKCKKKNIKKQSPLKYDYAAFNVNAQIKKDIKKSNQINKWRFFLTVASAIKYTIRQAKKIFQSV